MLACQGEPNTFPGGPGEPQDCSLIEDTLKEQLQEKDAIIAEQWDGIQQCMESVSDLEGLLKDAMKPLKCGPGEFLKSKKKSPKCAPCVPGRYSSDESTKKCNKCPPNTHTRHFGALECVPCPVGYTTYGKRGAKQCRDGDGRPMSRDYVWNELGEFTEKNTK
jgi:hypothetical protein